MFCTSNKFNILQDKGPWNAKAAIEGLISSIVTLNPVPVSENQFRFRSAQKILK